MAADAENNVPHLHPVDVIVPLDYTVESVFLTHHHQRHFIFIREKDFGIPIHHLFKSRFFLSSIMPRKHLTTSSVIGSFLVDSILDSYSKSTEAGNQCWNSYFLGQYPTKSARRTQKFETSCVKNIDYFIGFAVDIVIIIKLEESHHLLLSDYLPCYTIIYYHRFQFKVAANHHSLPYEILATGFPGLFYLPQILSFFTINRG